jgi:hypothetical protein
MTDNCFAERGTIMKNLRLMFRTVGSVLLLSVLVPAGQAQNREKFGISAKAGGVNAVSGRVMVMREGQAAQLLSSQDDLVAGDVVTTGGESQAEVLLNPGSYLRIAENSEFVLVDNSLDNLVVKLVKGSAIIEATGGVDVDQRINVLANRQHLLIIRGGIYRFNVQPAAADLLVRKGRVLTGLNPSEMVKGGSRVTYTAGGPVAVKLNKKDQDDFDLWSKQRAQTLARANQKISGRTVNGYLASMSTFDLGFSGWRSMGLWTYSPLSRCYTFMPFRWGWSSPYGNSYDNYYYNPYRGPSYGPNGLIVGNSGSSSGGSGPAYPGGSSGGNAGGSNGSSSVGPSAPSSTMGSPAGRIDPDSGNRIVNKIRDPNN